VTREARELAESMGVRIFSADIIYHLFDQFTAYLKQACTSRQHSLRASDRCQAGEAAYCVCAHPYGLRMLRDRMQTSMVCNTA